MTLSRDVEWGQQKRLLQEIQEGKCGVCHGECGLSMVLDHDHETGQTRGLLCQSCNCTVDTSPHPDNLPYLADPPAAEFGWEWQSAWGDWWLDTQTAEYEACLLRLGDIFDGDPEFAPWLAKVCAGGKRSAHEIEARWRTRGIEHALLGDGVIAGLFQGMIDRAKKTNAGSPKA